jgi:hypothetical protein
MKFLRGFLNLLLVSIAITAVFFPVAVFVHEGTHYVMYTIEGIQVTSLHVLDPDSLENGRFGYVTTLKESGYGNLIYEGVANIVGYLFLAMTLLFFFLVPFKPFTFHQLESMGLKRTLHQFHVPNM